MKRNIIIFGAQASGKGTQAEMLSQEYGLEYISSGNIFRQEIDGKTELGISAQKYINEGKLVPDDVTSKMIMRAIEKTRAKKNGFILDGYPRNESQMKSLEDVVDITDVIVIDISDEEALLRIGGRMVCVCGMSYHNIFKPPKIKNICDKCGRRLLVRKDDKPKAIEKRLNVYHNETEPLFDYYQKKGIVRRINGKQSIENVYKDIKRALKSAPSLRK